MAGDWIKMECNTPDKPEVLAITAKMGWDDTDLTVGKLFRLWRWFDQHTTEGNAVSVTAALLNRYLCVSGFVEIVASVGWLVITDEGVSLPKFEKHNSATAKQRAQTAKRVSKHKSNAEGNADSVTKTVTRALPREEKRREEKKKREKTIAPPAAGVQSPPEPVLLSIPLNDGSEYLITESMVTELQGLYPSTDVPQQLRSMRGWCLGNPTRRKTRNGVRAFIHSWLAKEQNRGGNHAQSGSTGGRRLTPAEQVDAAYSGTDGGNIYDGQFGVAGQA